MQKSDFAHSAAAAAAFLNVCKDICQFHAAVVFPLHFIVSSRERRVTILQLTCSAIAGAPPDATNILLLAKHCANMITMTVNYCLKQLNVSGVIR